MGIYEDLRQGRADVDDFAEVGGADTAAKDQKRTRALRAFNRAAKRYRELAAQQEELAATPEGHVRVHARLQSRLVRAQVRFSRALREVPFSAAQWTVFTNAFRDAEDELIALDSRLSQRRGEARELRRRIRECEAAAGCRASFMRRGLLADGSGSGSPLKRRALI